MCFGPSVYAVVDVCLFKNESILFRYILEDIDLIVGLFWFYFSHLVFDGSCCSLWNRTKLILIRNMVAVFCRPESTHRFQRFFLVCPWSIYLRYKWGRVSIPFKVSIETNQYRFISKRQQLQAKPLRCTALTQVEAHLFIDLLTLWSDLLHALVRWSTEL